MKAYSMQYQSRVRSHEQQYLVEVAGVIFSYGRARSSRDFHRILHGKLVAVLAPAAAESTLLR
jgi:hypothetical protein